jgi:hypothetical protein
LIFVTGFIQAMYAMHATITRFKHCTAVRGSIKPAHAARPAGMTLAPFLQRRETSMRANAQKNGQEASER